MPRETVGSFEPPLVRKRQRRLTGVDEMVLLLSGKGLTHGEISAHLAEVHGASLSKQTISTITDSVRDGMTEWQSCPLDRVHPAGEPPPAYSPAPANAFSSWQPASGTAGTSVPRSNDL